MRSLLMSILPNSILPLSSAISLLGLAGALTACDLSGGKADPTDTASPTGVDQSDIDNLPSCTEFQSTSGDHLGLGGYADTTASSGDECLCSFTVGSTSTPASYYVTDLTLSGAVPRPARVALDTPFSAPTSRTPNPPAANIWEAPFNNAPSGAVTVVGDYSIWQSAIDYDRAELACADYPGTRLALRVGPAGPPAVPQDTDGKPEKGIGCTSGEPIVSRFQLHSAPGRSGLVPLFTEGEANYAGLEIREVRVISWGDADELELRHDTDKLVLTPSGGPGALAADTAWLASATWHSDGTIGQLPLIEVEGSCYQGPEVRAVEPGYSSKVNDLLPWVSSEAPVVARVLDDASDGASGYSHHLMFEVEGTGFAQGIPLMASGSNAWDFEIDNDWMSAEGAVTRSGDKLVISVESGELLGTTELSGREYILPRYSH